MRLILKNITLIEYNFDHMHFKYVEMSWFISSREALQIASSSFLCVLQLYRSDSRLILYLQPSYSSGCWRNNKAVVTNFGLGKGGCVKKKMRGKPR